MIELFAEPPSLSLSLSLTHYVSCSMYSGSITTRNTGL